jgi:thiol-disulfide isomerase/thioredoxin
MMKSLVFFLAALAGLCLLPEAQAKRAPNLELMDQAQKTQRISNLRGSIAVVNFWATWCGPCREELPMLTRLGKEYGEKKVRFVAVSADEMKNRAAVTKFVSANQLDMEVWLGANVDMLERANLGNELPATMILDEQGEVVARVLGQAREEDIRKSLDWLLGGKIGPAPEQVVKHY